MCCMSHRGNRKCCFFCITCFPHSPRYVLHINLIPWLSAGRCPNLNNSVNLQGTSVKSERPDLTGNIQKSLTTLFHFQWMCEREWEGERIFGKGKGLWIKCERVSALLNRLRDWVKPETWFVPLYFILLFLVSWAVSWDQESKEKTQQTDLKGTWQRFVSTLLWKLWSEYCTYGWGTTEWFYFLHNLQTKWMPSSSLDNDGRVAPPLLYSIEYWPFIKYW